MCSHANKEKALKLVMTGNEISILKSSISFLDPNNYGQHLSSFPYYSMFTADTDSLCLVISISNKTTFEIVILVCFLLQQSHKDKLQPSLSALVQKKQRVKYYCSHRPVSEASG